MIRFKNRNGFTILESIIAIAILCLILLPIFLLQSNLLQQIRQSSEYVDTVALAHNALYEQRIAALNNPEPIENASTTITLKEPAVTILYTQTKVNPDSVLGGLQNFYLEKVVVRGSPGSKRKSESIATFLYKPAPTPPEQQR